jgi:hypothetical protein
MSPISPMIEEMFTICPEPRSIMCGSTAWHNEERPREVDGDDLVPVLVGRLAGGLTAHGRLRMRTLGDAPATRYFRDSRTVETYTLVSSRANRACDSSMVATQSTSVSLAVCSW